MSSPPPYTVITYTNTNTNTNTNTSPITDSDSDPNNNTDHNVDAALPPSNPHLILAMRDYHASQDPCQWGLRQPRYHRSTIYQHDHNDIYQVLANGDQEALGEGWTGWVQWFVRLVGTTPSPHWMGMDHVVGPYAM